MHRYYSFTLPSMDEAGDGEDGDEMNEDDDGGDRRVAAVRKFSVHEKVLISYTHRNYGIATLDSRNSAQYDTDNDNVNGKGVTVGANSKDLHGSNDVRGKEGKKVEAPPMSTRIGMSTGGMKGDHEDEGT